MPKYLDIDGLRTLWAQITNKISQESNATAEALEGKADLVEGKIPTSQLPSYVDDVLEYASKASFPATGESGKIYLDLATNLAYRWGGTAYTEISPSLALGTTSSTAYRGDYGAAAYKHAVTNKGIAKSSGLYKITTNAEGHVTAATAVAKADITGLGIPAQDTTYENATTTTDGLMSSEDKTKLDNLQEDLITIVEKEGPIVSAESIEGLTIHPISYIEPVQSGSGDSSPDNVRAISGWDSVNAIRTEKNLFGGKTLAEAIKALSPSAISIDENAGTVTFRAGDAGNNNLFNVKNNASRYTLVLKGKNSAYTRTNIAFYYTDGTYSMVEFEGVDTVSTVLAHSQPNKQVRSVGTILYGSSTTLYYNECGLFEGILTQEDFEPYKGQTISADLPETVYGGTLDWTTGVLMVTHHAMVFDGTETITRHPNAANFKNTTSFYVSIPEAKLGQNTSVSSHFKQTGIGTGAWDLNAVSGLLTDYTEYRRKYFTWGGVGQTVAEFKAWLAEQYAAGTPVTLVYELETPYTIQLTPQQLSTIDGTNYVWSDCGDTKAIFNLTPASNNLATTTTNGLMSAADKTKLDGINLSALVKSVNGITPDSNGNVAIEIGGGTVSGDYLPLTGGTLTGTLYRQSTAGAIGLAIGTASKPENVSIISVGDGTEFNRFSFRQYGTNGNRENFNLPNTTTPAQNVNYTILTTKNAVTVAQGGTGATTAPEALENLGALPLAGGTTTGKVYLANGSGVHGTDAGWTSIGFYGTSNKLRGSLMLTDTNCFHFNQQETGATYAERYKLPIVTTGLTKDVWYAILTSKNAVTVAQGGTGATTAAAARTNLGITPANIGALPSSGGTLTGNLTISDSNNYSYLYLANQNGENLGGLYASDSENRLYLINHAPNSTAGKYEGYGLPAVTTDNLTANKWYKILTSKETVTIEQGGTGATTAAAARTALGITLANIGAAPTSHASTATTYGAASASNYGHAMASSTTPKALGTAAVGSETAKFARGDHVHALPALTSCTGTLTVAKGGTGKTTLTSGYALIGNGTSAVSLRAITNNTEKGPLNWASTTGTNLITSNTLAYWNGAYNETSSNLTVLGTITKGVWKATKIGIAYGGTGATTATGARENLLIKVSATAPSSPATGTIWVDIS